jgi:hypothetical protein
MNRSFFVSKLLAGVGQLAIVTTSGVAWAEPPPPVDVVVQQTAPRKILAIEWNPVALIIGRVSVDVVVAPVNHHALVLSPFYASTSTVPINVVDASGTPSTELPKQTFDGFGGELGYRYYFGQRGPRGFFLGPSLILGRFKATAQNGSETPFVDYGFAADAGYEMLIADSVAIALGGGLQYSATSKSIPDQQWPADIYANNGVRPRLLCSLGWAF